MLIDHLRQLIKEHQGGMPVSVLTATGSAWTACVLYAVDEIGILMAEEKVLTVRKIVPWSNIRGVSWNTDE